VRPRAAILFGLGIVRGLGYFVVGTFDRDAFIACAAALPLMAVGIYIGNHSGIPLLMR